VTREVLVRKLALLRRYLRDLEPHAGRAAGDLRADPYAAERLLELVVQVAVDILTHELAERGVVPETYRKAFLLAGEQALLPPDLAAALADAAGLRNIIVHRYDEVDYQILAASIARALRDFHRLLDLYAGRLDG
jgi:uncharacterized protein YutE (UPF0331/DUF86 family)